MKNKRLYSFIALLLVLVMSISMLAACKDKTDGGAGEDTPVSVFGPLSNFLKFNVKKDQAQTNLRDVTKDLGRLVESNGKYALLFKADKDRMNNLTETYTVYSLEKKAAVMSVSNAYPDEFGGLDKHGNETHPEKVIANVELTNFGDVVILTVNYECYTPIADEIIEKDELDHSYSNYNYTEFYDMAGTLISTSYSTDRARFYSQKNDTYVISCGKTYAHLNKDSVLVDSYDGDVESEKLIYDHSNDKYNYLLNVPIGVNDEASMMNNSKIEVYDKEGNLVCTYSHGEHLLSHVSYVLQSGDILIQHLMKADAADGDIVEVIDDIEIMINVDTFILDVETGKVTELTDFGYVVQNLLFKDELADSVDEISCTDNVRNILVGIRKEDGLSTNKYYTVFMDNFGNVNFTFDGKLCYEMDDSSITVLDGEHLLVELDSSVADRAILDYSGNLIAYLPDGATVLSNCIVSGDTIYDFDMERIGSTGSDTDWEDNYLYTEFKGYYGDYAVYSFQKESDDGLSINSGVLTLNLTSSYIQHYDNFEFVRIDRAGGNGALSNSLILRDHASGVYNVINTSGTRVISIKASSYGLASYDGASLYTFETEDGYFTVILDSTQEGGSY